MEASSSSISLHEGSVQNWEAEGEGDLYKLIAKWEAEDASEDEFTYFSDGEPFEPGVHLLEEGAPNSGDQGLPQDQLQLGKPSTSKQGKVVEETAAEKEFEQFDVVQDYSDHYFANYKPPTGRPKEKIAKLLSKLHIINSPEKKHEELAGPTPEWVRRIQQEWKSLEKDLPEGIYVRVYEERMDLLRAAIVGSSGTPYHDGLFFFDVYFPCRYPEVPPLVQYQSRGIRLNPNLYANGRVCLSLLGTWFGWGCEKWSPERSTMLQVLVSLQAIVFNSKPYFNEPGYSLAKRTSLAKKKSLCYNESVFLLSCKTMLYTMRRPPKNFESFVVSHFGKRGRAILLACRAYMEGVTVGSQALSHGEGKSCSAEFRSFLVNYFNSLLKELEARGADCEGLVALQIKGS